MNIVSIDFTIWRQTKKFSQCSQNYEPRYNDRRVQVTFEGYPDIWWQARSI